MPFPLTRTGYLTPAAAAGTLSLEGPLGALRGQGACASEQQGGRVTFRVPWSLTSGPLWGITRGELVPDAGAAGRRLRYSLSLERGCLTIAVAVLLWVAFEVGWMGTAPVVAVWRGLVVWLCLWGAGYLWLAWRFPRFVRRALSETRRPAGP